MKFKLLIFLFLSSAIANAELVSNCPTSTINKVYSSHGQIIDCKNVQELDSSFNQINILFNKNYSQEINIVLTPVGDNASFDLGSFLELPSRMVRYDRFGHEYPLSLAHLSPIAYHEYGHYLFQELLKSQFPRKYDTLFALFQKISHLKAIGFEKNQAYLDKEILEKVMSEIKAHPEIKLFNEIITPYTELYADIIAVYFSNDKNAILNALYYDEMNSTEYQMVRHRSFDSRFDKMSSMYMSGPHNFFAMTREYIGKNLFPKNEGDKNSALIKIEKAMIKNIQIDYERGKLLDFDTKNQELINAIKAI